MRVPLVYLHCCPVPNCLGKQGELSENCLPNLTVRFILSPSILIGQISGSTPLMCACAGGHEDVVKALLEAGANVEDQNENGNTPLMEAASAGHVGVAKASFDAHLVYNLASVRVASLYPYINNYFFHFAIFRFS